MEIVSKKGEEPDSSFTEAEIAMLNPSIVRITEKINYLSPIDCLEALMLIAAAIRRQHSIDESFDPIQFVLRESVQQEYQVAA